MAVPKEIRDVKRPTNTVVVQRGGGPRRYAVVERIGCRRVDGRNVPVNGYTVGHIIDGAFVPLAEPVGRRKAVIRDWGDIVLVDRVSRPLLDELLGVYETVDAMRIYVMALLKVCHPGVQDYMLDHHYRLGWASTLFPGLPMGKNSVSTFLKALDSSYSLIEQCIRPYQDVTDFGDAWVHSDHGSEFVNVIASVMTARLIKHLDGAGLLSTLTYDEIMARLATAKKVDTTGDGEWELVQTTAETEEILIRLDLLPTPEQLPKRKPGRPRKSPC